MKTINQEFIRNMREIPVELGELFREFESKNPITEDTREYVSNLWEFLSNELPNRLESETLKKQREKRKKKQQIKLYKKKLLQLQRPDRYEKRFAPHSNSPTASQSEDLI